MNKSLLHPEHYADLKEKSGLSDETIQQAEIKTIPPDQINKLIGFNVPDLTSAYEIPYGNGFSRIKAFYEKGKEFYSFAQLDPFPQVWTRGVINLFRNKEEREKYPLGI